MTNKISLGLVKDNLPFAAIGSLLLFPLIIHNFGLSLHALKGLLFTAFLLLIAAIDQRTQSIYDKTLLPFLLIGILFLPYSYELSAYSALTAAFLYSGLLLLLRFLSHGGMGGGDIKLAFVIGIWLGLPAVVPAGLFAFWLGALFSIIFIWLRGASTGQKIAFGPFMAAGAIISFLFSEPLISLYRSFVYG